MSQEPFADLDAYVALPRIEGLRLSPGGDRLVIGAGTPERKNARYVTALWEVDPQGEHPARRVTRSEQGESLAGFTAAGDLLFVSTRDQPGKDADDDRRAALWLQPAGGGDARVLASPRGGVRGVQVSASGRLVLGSGLLPSAKDMAADEELRTRRKDGGVSAILHEDVPVRYWDHDLGPGRTRLLIADLPGTDAELTLRDLTGDAGWALNDMCSWDITPDGATVVSMWVIGEPGGAQRTTLVAIDVASGQRRVLADDPGHDYENPRVSPDGTRVAVVVSSETSADAPGDGWLSVIPLDGGDVHPLTSSWDRLPGSVEWTPDSTALIVTADDQGRSPLWHVDATTGEVRRLTADDGAYTSIEVAPDGRFVYALRSAIDAPPAPVRVALPDGELTVLPGPADPITVPGRLEEITATAADGTPLRAWLALPDMDTPAPLLLWIHGGPQSSWNAWQWRWNPWLAVARGYAVLLPDPALSTGYGTEFIRRGWGAWGDAPYTDLLAITDVAQARPDIDASRVGAMGGSFGGYMANWIAGHTDRFQAIVSHASLWSLEPFVGTTDYSFYWARELTRDMAAAHSPHLSAAAITTPMLVIHGDKDYRVPIAEGLSLWWALTSGWTKDEPSPHKFLYFPDENHWILKPGNIKVWYETVFSFLAQHVLGEEWRRPELLG